MATGAAWAGGVARQRASNVERISAPERQVIQAIGSPSQKAPEGRGARPRAPRLVAVPCPVHCVCWPSARRGDGVLIRLFMRAELHPQ